MNEEQTTVRNVGVGFTNLLTVLFIALKLTGTGAVAAWSWAWVLSPLWIPAAVVLAIIAMLAIIAACRWAAGSLGVWARQRNIKEWEI